MIPRAWTALLATGVALGPTPVLAHGHHTTVAEMHHRPAAQVLEVSLLLSPDDLDHALDGRVAPAQVEAYVRARFEVRVDGEVCPIRWAGLEPHRRGVWAHFEVLGLPTLDGAVLHHRVLLDSEPFVFHTVHLVAGDGVRRTRTLDRSHPSLRLDLHSGRRSPEHR